MSGVYFSVCDGTGDCSFLTDEINNRALCKDIIAIKFSVMWEFTAREYCSFYLSGL